MIKNAQQENLTKERIAELKQDRDTISQNQEMSEIEKLYSLNSFDGMISTLQEELDEYESLKSGNLHIIEAKSLEELPKLIIKARIAQHMSQTDLAKKIGIQAQQIQRYEANDYQNISLYRLMELAKAVGICTSLENTVIIGSGPKFEVPTSISEEEILNAERITKERCSLFI
ncbi:helix-turn-helix transcriptional regulator [Sphingobacterium sp.]|uniref:helix-turn-helix transcriptional regulator n=1 Tax=Sphingobacterium sp. TaxID=341027 RepID=UPI00289EABE2|nr:helix-turn-helix transcriptional regulator [Sphingobacterium sp.]